MYNNISIDALRALDAIERKGSFAAAAESLYKVPSALTYTIKKLEDEVGTPLFDRSKQRAQLTAAGRLVLEHGREILLATNRLYDSVQELESGWESEIRLARDTIVPEQKIFPLISKFNNLQQKVDVNLGVEVIGGGWDALHSRRADIVIGANGELPKGLFSTHKMGEISFVFALSPKHPLANSPNTISNEQLQDYASIVVSDTSQILPVRDSGLFKSRQLIRVNSMESKIAAQIEGLGVGFIPTHLAKPFLESGQLVEKECAIPRPSHEIYLAWHKDQTGKAFEWFIEQLCNLNWDF
ncbi:LysR substrate-binding domain-containing protein [Vibrio breoganii]|uniref:LysR substrate-binding domain-containing protein n=1 Tax=Vibrio breoganii TaxID=553239 RepID=UPI000C82F910|nr:LysR substrate-binding domain-containing protein [Vibrio breoganii]PMJ46164.1 LysR family transcriptional regulator [Vibrio breoganii]PMK58488.1 LysR family transcriptional regulator [Vibrio breoganii]PML33829.1 LysR family transcriptional regulator [Vibrio breoganii]PMM84278.1 LysR family transcriptional regulator [Vibrio breoganii]PMO28682.1 LysR family transcriptional regulator [Vibrio breoganii]